MAHPSLDALILELHELRRAANAIRSMPLDGTLRPELTAVEADLAHLIGAPLETQRLHQALERSRRVLLRLEAALVGARSAGAAVAQSEQDAAADETPRLAVGPGDILLDEEKEGSTFSVLRVTATGAIEVLAVQFSLRAAQTAACRHAARPEGVIEFSRQVPMGRRLNCRDLARNGS